MELSVICVRSRLSNLKVMLDLELSSVYILDH